MKNKITSFAHSSEAVSCDTVGILKIVIDVGVVVKLHFNHFPKTFLTTSHDKRSDIVVLGISYSKHFSDRNEREKKNLVIKYYLI